MRIPRQLAADLFFLAVLFISSGAMEAFTVSSTAADQGSPVMKLLWGFTYLVVLIRMVPRRAEIFALLRTNKSFVLLLVLSVVSTRWSLDAGATVKKAVPLLLSALVGLDFACRYSVRKQLRMVGMVLAVVIVMGVIAQLVFPGFVPKVDDDLAGNAWNGIVNSKNDWARLLDLAGVVLLCSDRDTRRRQIAVAGLFLLNLGLLAASRSAGGMLIMAMVMFMFVALRMLRWPRKALTASLSTIAIVTVLIVSFVVRNLDSLARSVGKDATLTGRVPIWREATHFIAQRPLLGYGFSAFWTATSQPAQLMREAVHWMTMPHAHNGYIDLTLQLGIVGLGLYAAAFFVGVFRAGRLVRYHREPQAAWPLLFLCMIFMHQLTESSIVAANQIIWILYSAVLFSLPLELSAGEARAYDEEEAVEPVPVLTGVV